MYLTEFFIKVTSSSHGRTISLLIVHVSVPVNVERLSKLDKLEGDLKTYWYQVVI